MTKMIIGGAAVALMGATALKEPRGLVAARAEAPMDPKAAVQAVQQEFAEFKATLDDKVRQEIKSGTADFVTADKLERIDAAITTTTDAIQAMNEKMAALELNGGGGDADPKISDEEREYDVAYRAFMRDGVEDGVRASIKAGNIRAAASVGVDSEGGHTVPVEWDRTLTDQLQEVSQMRVLATVQQVTGQGFRKLYNLHGMTSGWVNETAARPETDTPLLAAYDFAFGEIYANAAATQRILDDAGIDIPEWLGEETRVEFATKEGVAFMSGDGAEKPKGFLNYDQTTEEALPAAQRHPLGWIKEVNSGSAASLTIDGIIDLIYDLDDDRLSGARLFMNKKTAGTLRKFRDNDGNLIWNPPVSAGEPDTLLGEPITRISNMPNIAADATPIAYGNMAETYRIFDRMGVRLIRDPFLYKPYVMFYSTKRVGGGLWNPEWMRYHRVAA